MKQFLYCLSTTSGMDYRIASGPERLTDIPKWGEVDCEKADMALAAFMRRAEVGEMHEHRCGICVRLKDKE